MMYLTAAVAMFMFFSGVIVVEEKEEWKGAVAIWFVVFWFPFILGYLSK